MLRYVARRLGVTLLLLWIVSVVAFVLVRVVPGNPATSILGMRATPALVRQLNHDFGFDRPLPIQYGQWLWRALHGDLGYSLASSGSGNGVSGTSVLSILTTGLSVTVPLAILGSVIALVIGSILGALSASRAGGPVDVAVTGVSVVGLSIPDFYLAFILILVFTAKFNLLPSVGYPDNALADPVGALRSLALPAVTLGLINSTAIARTTRAGLVQELGEDYVTAAAARGAPSSVRLFKHAMRNVLGPVVTVGAIQFGYLCSGVIVVEKVFSLPGDGQQLLTAVEQRDYPTLQALIILFALFFIVANLAADLLQLAFDPRIRTAGRAA